MGKLIDETALSHFYELGYLPLKQAIGHEVLERVVAASKRLKIAYPLGFDHSEGFGSAVMKERKLAPSPGDRAPTIIYHNAGFLEPDLLLPILNPEIHELIERVTGKDFYLSNVWMQIVPPHTGRMGYHKDEHGSVSITIPLDEIEWDAGSTCLVPKSHRNTPPPNFCMENIALTHPREAQLTGAPGDLIFFTPETWHGRAANATDQPTCRLFYNFYSRRSRDSTRWSPCISPERVREVSDLFPDQCKHMLRIDPGTKLKNLKMGKFRQWVMHNGSSSSAGDLSSLAREYFYWKFAFRSPVGRDGRGRILPPFRTTVTESGQFSTLEYVSHLNLTRTIKNVVRLTANYWIAAVKPARKIAAKTGE